MEYNFGGEWQLGPKLNSGSFGELFKGKNIYTQEEIAIKLEPIAYKTDQLIHEAKILKHLEPALGFPKVRWYGHKTGFNVLVLDLLGPTLQELFNSVKKTLSLKTVLIIAEQLICRLEALHSFRYLHRDLKPENILIGRGNLVNLIYLIDFGLSKKFKKSNKEHIKYAEGKGFTGNQRFCSNNALMGIEQGRRDDLESLGYILIYLAKGKLPWENLQEATTSTKKEALIKVKVHLALEHLCDGIPNVFLQYMTYVKGLAFTAKPDYAYVKKIFRDFFIENQFVHDNAFEWRFQKVFLQNTKIGRIEKNAEFLPKIEFETTVHKEPEPNKSENNSCKLF